ncbi:hypothetical protein ABZX62_00115 [Streptomyces flavidovirens]|uniref:DUF6907 domain-containing protein n=1 Tax=Streptomyces flavidovirens TaxID=67298 RepID=UPI0033AFFFA2
MNHILAEATDIPQADAVSQPKNSLLYTVTAALAAAGADEAVIAEARQAVAAGQVFTEFTVAVHDQDNQDLIPIVDILGDLTVRVTANQSLKPLLDLIAQDKADEATAEPGHFPWCTHCVTRQDNNGGTYIDHVGPRIDLRIPHGMDCRNGQLLSADLGALEEFTGKPEVSFNSGGNGVLLDGPELNRVIGDLETFTEGLRAMHHQMEQERGQ